MKKSLIALMACAAMIAASASIAASSQAPPGMYAATSNKIGAGSGDIKQHGGGSGGITQLGMSDGKTFVLVPLGQGGSGCIVPMVAKAEGWDGISSSPPAGARAATAPQGEPPGAAVLI